MNAIILVQPFFKKIPMFYFFQVAAVFLFNLLVGVGILALPSAIAKAGVIAGILSLTTVSFMAFISVTFMIEVLATANAWRGPKTVVARKALVKGYPAQDDSVAQISQIKVKNDVFSAPLFEIEEKFEMGYMAELFLGTAGSTFFYAVLCLYLYGVSTIRLFIILPVTGENHNPNLQVSIYTCSALCSQHSFALPLIINGKHRMQSSITHNLIRHILTFCHVKLMQSIALEQGHFDLQQIAPTLPNLWFSLVLKFKWHMSILTAVPGSLSCIVFDWGLSGKKVIIINYTCYHWIFFVQFFQFFSVHFRIDIYTIVGCHEYASLTSIKVLLD